MIDSPETFKGFALFNDVEDAELRNRNRAVVLTNIAVNHSKNGLVTPGAAGLMLGYFAKVAAEDRASVQEKFIERMRQEGFKIEQPA